MFRLPDPWELDAQKQKKLSCGFQAGLDAKYERTGVILGKGGFGSVSVVKLRATGAEYACKSIQKLLDVPNISPARQEQHLSNTKQEVAVLRKLRGTLNVVHLEDVFEDDTHVHIVMELCRGGELLSKINSRHYSERTVASYMRAVLRTIAQCHHHRILHRDIKPGNFMLLTDAEDAPVKAIDFGLAVFFDSKDLPVRHLGLEGTPHYMAPENLSSEVYPESDVWAAGVMAYQLLSSQFPFDDWKNPRNPALSQLWKSILSEEPKFSGRAWQDVSDGAKDFVRHLLVKDVKQRPSAQQALTHPWVQGKSRQRKEGKPLAATIVQRLQKFSTENAFKRTVLDMIANELLARHMQQQLQQRQQQQVSGGGMPVTDANAMAGDGQQPQQHSGHSPVQDSPLKGLTEQGASRQLTPPPVAAKSLRLERLRRDPSSPHLRSLAAVSLISQLHNKSATVHAGGAAGALLQGSGSGPAPSLDTNRSRAGRGVSLDWPNLGATAPSPHAAPAPGTIPEQQQQAAETDQAMQGVQGDVMTITATGSGAREGPEEPQLQPLLPAQSSEPMTLIAHMPMPAYSSSPSTGPLVSQMAAAGGDAPLPRAQHAASLPAGGTAGPFAKVARPVSPASPARAESTGTAGAGSLQRRSFYNEGSGHALSHYAFLLAAGERSLHGITHRQAIHRSQSHASLAQHRAAAQAAIGMSPAGESDGRGSPGIPIAAGLRSPAAVSPQVPFKPGSLGRHAGSGMELAAARLAGTKRSVDQHHPQLPHAASVHGAPQGISPGTVPGVDDMHRLLLAVQRQRQEHRKLQRLMLDTSGHAGSLYYSSVQGKAVEGGPQPSRASEADLVRLADNAAQSAQVSTDLDLLAEGGPATAKRKSLLHKVSNALLKPVKELISSGKSRSSSASQSLSQSLHGSGAFGSMVTSAEPSHKGTPDAGPSKEASRHEPDASGAMQTPPTSLPRVRLSKREPDLAAAVAAAVQDLNEGDVEDRTVGGSSSTRSTPTAGASGPGLPTRTSLSIQDVLAAERPDDGEAAKVAAAEAPPEAADGKGRGASFESGGRGRGAYAALVATLSPAASGALTLPSMTEPSMVASAVKDLGVVAGGPDDADEVGRGRRGSSAVLSPPRPGSIAETTTSASDLGMAIHTVKAHKRVPSTSNAAEKPGEEEHTIAAQLARIEQAEASEPAEPSKDGTAGTEQGDGTAHVGGTVSKGKLYDMLGHLLGGPAQLAEFQAVMAKLNYDKHSELSFDEISKGLQCLGYRLEPSEVAVLLSEVALGGQHISQGAFLASQVDWRQFQANHKDEWMALLRTAFNGMARDTDGRIGEDEIVALLSSKLPEDEVNLAVQETLLDAAVMGAEGLDFDDFARLLAAPSESDLLSLASIDSSRGTSPVASDDTSNPLRRLPSIDLYDARVGGDGSQHGRNNYSVRGRQSTEGVHADAAGQQQQQPAAPVVASIAPSDLVAGAQYYLPPSWLADIAAPAYHPGLETVPDEEAE